MQLLRTAPQFLLIAAALVAPQVARAATVTIPEGYMTFTIPAGSQTTPSVSTFSLPLSPRVPSNFVGQSIGAISSVGTNTITNDSAGWTPGALSTAATPYFIRITSGVATGRTFLISTSASNPNTASTVTVDNQGTPLTGANVGIVAGDRYELFPAYTLSSLFGNSVLGGTSSSVADVVRLHNGSGWTEYYFNTSTNPGHWRVGSVPVSQDNVAIRPDSGIIFYRRGTSQIDLTLMGKVPSTDLQIVVNEVGATFVTGFPMDFTLDASDYKSMPTWVQNTGSVTDADKVTAYLSGSWKSFNYSQSAGQWRVSTVPVNQGPLVTIPAGIPVIIESPSGATGLKIWKRTLPYSLSAN